MTDRSITFVASAIISEIQSSDIYLTIKAILFDLKTNKNGVRVTSAFMDEIVENEDRYIGIPLCADVNGLVRDKEIGHMFDPVKNEFHSSAIGAFYHFEKEEANGNAYLIGYARVMKRNKEVCRAIMRLYAEQRLNFSFEISCGFYTELDNGDIEIDRHPDNMLEGAAIVTHPACESASAMLLVAEEKGVEKMNEATNTSEVIADQAAVVSEETPAAAPETTVSEANAEETVSAESENVEIAEDAKKQPEPEEESPTESEEKVAEDDNGEDNDKECDCTEEEAACNEHEKKNAEEKPSFAEGIMAELAQLPEIKAMVASLTKELDELRNAIKENTSKEESRVNPFISEMSSGKRYSLLEKDENEHKTWSLLDKA